MDSLQATKAFLGWCTVINIGILAFASIFLAFLRPMAANLHSKMVGLSESELARIYFQFLAQYKIAIYIFNLVPYIALCLIQSN